jgi:hypothetical protein
MSGPFRCDNPAVYECPVCGSEELTAKPYETWPPPQDGTITPPYEDYLGKPSYEVCPNCGFEFGNDDNPGAGEAAAVLAPQRRRRTSIWHRGPVALASRRSPVRSMTLRASARAT